MSTEIQQFSQAEKKRQAYNLAIRGSNVQTVAHIMGVSPATVRAWIDSYKTEIQGTISQINREDYATLFMNRMDQIRQEAWTHFGNAKKDSERRAWLRMAMDVEVKEKDGLMDLGLIDKQPTQHEHQHSVVIGVGENEVRPEQLDALAAMALSGSMGLSAEDALAMCGRPAAPLPTPKGHMPHDVWDNEIEDAVTVQDPVVAVNALPELDDIPEMDLDDV